MLNFAQIEIFRRLLEHLLEEKIEYATTFTVKERAPVFSEGSGGEDKSSNTIVKEEVIFVKDPSNGHGGEKGKNVNNSSFSSSEEKKSIAGKIKGETKKALLLIFDNGQETWIPKSTIHSTFSSDKEKTQSFLVDTWILERNNISV